MADVDDYDKIVTEFLINTCRLRHNNNRLRQPLNEKAVMALVYCADVATARRVRVSPEDENGITPMLTGSVAELYIEPMLSCVGDIDIMFNLSDELAIPAGTAPPTQLPGEFHRRVEVYEIVDSEFPGYVYLVSSYLLTECIDDGRYNAVRCQRAHLINREPAQVNEMSLPYETGWRLLRTRFSEHSVYCMRCLSWPPQADVWPTRRRNYDWPDSATVDRVVGNGYDVVYAAHRRCRQDTRMHRLSFSRAEIVLLNSWIPVQQIVYHMLRVFIKTERLTDSPDNSDVATLSNYHIKTLMLWACELNPRSWWIDDLNVVRLSVELLRTLGVWLIDACCPHYFIHNCNLFDHPDNCYYETASRVMSKIEGSLSDWFIKNYVRNCAQCLPGNVSRLFHDIWPTKQLQKAVSAIADWRCGQSLVKTFALFLLAQYNITAAVSYYSLTVGSYLCIMRDLVKLDERLCMYLIAIVFLHGAYKTTTDTLTDDLLDVLATTSLQSNDVRRCVNARHSSVLSLRQAAKLMKIVANNLRSTVQLINIELSKAYLHRALRCKDSDSNSIYCLANVYLAVLYYNTGHYQTVIDRCTMVTRSQDRSQFISNVVQGELLPKIDDDIDTVLGLAVFYQYVRTAALNQQQQMQRVSVFTTELFAHYLRIRRPSVLTCPLFSSEWQRYVSCTLSTKQPFITDVLLLRRVKQCEVLVSTINSTDLDTSQLLADHLHIKYRSVVKCRYRYRYRSYNLTTRQSFIADALLQSSVKMSTGQKFRCKHLIRQCREFQISSTELHTSELVELLQQSAVEHLTTYRQLEAHKFGSVVTIVTTDFEALYAYKRGDYQRCLQLSTQNVQTLLSGGDMPPVLLFPQFIQLFDDDIVSLSALIQIAEPPESYTLETDTMSISQVTLSLYLMTQCQLKLHQSATSLAQTLNYIEAAQRRHSVDRTLDHLTLKFAIRKTMISSSSS